jgi:hypothetical protein
MSDPIEQHVKWALENWGNLGVIASEQHGPLLPVAIRARKANGKIEERAACLMVLDGERVIEARKRARKWAVDQKLDPKRIDGEDSDIVRKFEELEELAYALREVAEPHDQMYPDGRELYRSIRTPASLSELSEQLDNWTKMNDPRYGDLDADQLWEMCERVVREGTALPLALIDSRAQIAFIMLTAAAALEYRKERLRFRSRSTSSSAEEAATI